MENGYDKVALLITIFCPMLILMGIENVIGTQYLLPAKRQKEFTISVFLGVVANLILNSIFIRLWSSVGASIATILSQLVVDSVQIYYVRNDINFKPLIRLIVRYLFASTIMFFACSVIKIFIKIGILTIILQCAIGITVYIGLLILMRDKFLQAIIDKVKSKIPALNRT